MKRLVLAACIASEIHTESYGVNHGNLLRFLVSLRNWSFQHLRDMDALLKSIQLGDFKMTSF